MVRSVHGVLHSALRDAVKWELVVRNAAESADAPRPDTKEITAWTADQLHAFLTATTDERLHPLWITLATTGVRRGEALALRWSDVDLGTARCSIRRTVAWVDKKATFTEPKTKQSRRQIPLAPETVAALRDLRKRQLEERLAAGPIYADLDLVFADEIGAPLTPGNVTRIFGGRVRKAGAAPLTVHGLRHTFATLALGAGVPVKIVSEILGHSTTAITSDTYQHVTETMGVDAISRVTDAVFRSR